MNSFIPKAILMYSNFNYRFSFFRKLAVSSLLLVFATGGYGIAQVFPSWDYLFIGSRSFDSHRDFFPSLNEEERQMVDSLKRFAEAPYIHLIHQNAGNYFLMNACGMMLYQWQDDEWMPYAGKPVKGANCASFLFFRDNEPYSYSGVGYWQSHGDVFHFTQTGETELVKTHHPLSDFYGTLRFTTTAGLYSFFGHHFNLRTVGPEGFLWKGYFLDFSDMHWKEMDFELNENFEKVFGVKTFDKKLYSISSFESDDFAFTELINQDNYQSGLIIVDKRTLELRIQSLKNSYFHELIWLQKKGNSLRFFTTSKPTISELEISELFQSALPLGKVRLKEDAHWKELVDKYWKELLGLVLISLILLGIGKVALPKQPKNIPDPPSELGKEDNQVLSVLKSYLGQVISQEEMDRIVGIDTIKNQDLRKVRRSRAIKALNDYMIEQHGEPIIQRVRDEQDMRIIRYLIEDNFSSKSTKTPEPMIKSPL